MSFRPTPAREYTEQSRQLLTAALDDRQFVWGDQGGVTPDGALTFAIGAVAGGQAEGFALALASTSPRTADPVALIGLGADRGLVRREASRTRIELLIDTIADPFEVTEDSEFRGFGDDGQARWSLIAAYKGGTQPLEEVLLGSTPVELEAGDVLEIEAIEPGRTELPSGISTAIAPFPPVDGLVLEFSRGDDVLYRGEDAESEAQFRARLTAAPSAANGSTPGLYAALLQVTGVRTVSLQTVAPAVGRITVTGTDALGDLVEVAEVAYRNLPVFTVIEGAIFIQVPGVDGRPFTLPLNVGATEAVEVDFTMQIGSGITREDAVALGRAVIEEAFARAALEGLDRVNYFQTLARMAFSDQIRAVDLRFNGAPADAVAALPTNTLVPDFGNTRALRPGET